MAPCLRDCRLELPPRPAAQDPQPLSRDLTKARRLLAVALGEPAHDEDRRGREGPARRRRSGCERKKAKRGDLSVLYSPEDVLELGQRLGKAHGGLTVERGRELEGVAEPLPADAGTVEVVRGLRSVRPFRRGAHGAVTLLAEGRRRDRGGDARAGYAPARPLARERDERSREPLPAGGVEGVEQAPSRLFPLGLEEGPEVGESGAMLVARPPFGPPTQLRHVRELHVEVPHGPELGGDPSQLLAHGRGPRRKRGRKDVQRGTQPARRDAHVVELLGVFAQAGARLVREELTGLLADHGVGEVAHRRVGRDVGGPQVRRARYGQACSEQPGLELGERRGAHPGRVAQVGYDRRERVEPTWRDLHLHPPKPRGRLVGANHDRGVVERDLRDLDARRSQREGLAPRADLQHLHQRSSPRHCVHASSDWAARPQRGQPGGERLGELETSPQPTGLRGARLFQRHFDGAPALARPQHEPRLPDAPVRRVHVAVDEAARRLGEDSEGRHVGVEAGRERCEPAFDGSEVQCVELPLDLGGARAGRSGGSGLCRSPIGSLRSPVGSLRIPGHPVLVAHPERGYFDGRRPRDGPRPQAVRRESRDGEARRKAECTTARGVHR